MKGSPGELALRLLLESEGITGWEREYKFHPTRKWRFDFAWPELKLAAEVEGGGWSSGRHTRGSGFKQDLEKYDEAMRLGWNIYRCDTQMAKSGAALETIKILIEQCGG